jgi:hypothetical protein
MQHNTNSVQRAQTTCGHSTTKRNGQSAAHCRQHATRHRQHARCAGQHAACIMAACIMQRTQQQTTDRVQHATSNVQHATDIAQRISANTQRAECNRQRIEDDVQQTADDMQEDACSVLTHPSCNGKDTALPHFVRGEQRAVHNQQHARTTSAQHGTDATHKMQHTTPAAACSKLT